MIVCACGSTRFYHDCCGRYISGQEVAPSPEALMRSRYTAYTQANIGYIVQTQKEQAAKNFDAKSAEAWASGVTWLGLQVIAAFPVENNIAYVEFIARYQFNGQEIAMHELSQFHYEKDRWYYVDGRQMN